MMRSKSWQAVLLILVAVLLMSTEGRAQEPGAKPQLIPGSADVIHDILGIAIGMTCQEALDKAKQISPSNGKYIQKMGNGNVGRPPGEPVVEYNLIIYRVAVNMVRPGIVNDQLEFSCVEDGGRSEVVIIKRSINLQIVDEKPPSIASVRATFQEKFGVPTIEYSPTVFATIFNRSGAVSNKINTCAQFINSHLYNDQFYGFDPNKCTYALTLVANESSRSPGSVSSIEILIKDHLRLENAVRAMIKRKLENTPVAAPKF